MTKNDVSDSTTGPGLSEKYLEEQVVNCYALECEHIECCSDSAPKCDLLQNKNTPKECFVESSSSRNCLCLNPDNTVQVRVSDCSPISQSNDQLIYSTQILSNPHDKHLSTVSYKSSRASPDVKTDFSKECRLPETNMKSLSGSLVKDSDSKSSCMSGIHQAAVEGCEKSLQNAQPCFSVKKQALLHKRNKVMSTKRKHGRTFDSVSEKECRPCEVFLERLSSDHIKCWFSTDYKRLKVDQDCIQVPACLGEGIASHSPYKCNLVCNFPGSYDHSLPLWNVQSVSNVELCDSRSTFKTQPVNMCEVRKEIINETVLKKEYQPCVVRLERLSDNSRKEFLRI